MAVSNYASLFTGAAPAENAQPTDRPVNTGYRILLVDDEESILTALVRLLRQDNYHVLTANSAQQALAVLAAHQVCIIITDQRMPEMSGIELLEKVRQLYPNTVRMVLSGYADLDSVMEAVNRGAIYKFLTKPWDDVILRATVFDAFRHHELLQERERLASEIEAANCELTRINQELAQLLEEKTRQMVRIEHYDSLTDLPNRLLFTDRLQQALVHAQRNQHLVALMLLGIDNFKAINNSLGHPVGDIVLQQLAERFAAGVRTVDTVSRLGGDEFAFVLTDLTNAQDAATIAQAVMDMLCAPFTVGEEKIFISAGIGISVYPSDGADTATLVKNAGAALSYAKEQGRNNYQYYANEMNIKACQRLTLETGLRYALEREEFVLHYQPQISLVSGRIVGVEALLRWQHPERGLVGPLEFIPLLEETGLILPVGEWVLHTACRQNKAWQQLGFPPLRMAVNLSALQFLQVNFANMVAQILHMAKMDASLQELEFELTESMLMKGGEAVITTLRQLHEMGVKISIDDFGTGYSSLSYLKRFPIDCLKIDQSFVHDLGDNSDDKAIVSAIIALGHSLKMRVIAEGVETPAQLDLLRQMDCDEMQGYLFSRPLPAADVARLLRDIAPEGLL